MLKIPLSLESVIKDYAPLLDDMIYTEEEFDELPAKPKMKGRKHGSFCSCKECEAAHVVIGGEIVAVKTIKTKKGDPMAFVDVVYGVNQWSCTFFNWAYKKFAAGFTDPTAFLLAGHKDDRGQILVYDMQDISEVAAAHNFVPERLRDRVVALKKPKKLKIKRKVAA